MVNYQIEILNSLISNKPELKIWLPIMIVRNLYEPIICNGSRLAVKELMAYVIEPSVLTGHGKDEDDVIHSFALLPS